MKIYLVNNARMPTEKAHGYQIAKMGEAFAMLGYEVELIIPKRINEIVEDVFDYYKIKKIFSITYLDSFDFFFFEKIIGSKLSFYVQSLFFKLKVKSLRLKVDEGSVAITRNPELVATLKAKGLEVFFDAHRWPESKNQLYRLMLRDADGIICNSRGTANEFKINGFRNIISAANGVDLVSYNIKASSSALKKELVLPPSSFVAMYVGHLYSWKGVDVVLASAELMRNEDIYFVLVGGTEKDISAYRQKIKKANLEKVILLGHRKKEKIPALQMGADVLLLPNIPVNQESDKFTSPLKMFEYMASGVPILASMLPSITEVLNEENAFLFKAGDALAMKEALLKIINNPETAKLRAQKAKQDSKFYTWENRAQKIIDFMNAEKND